MIAWWRRRRVSVFACPVFFCGVVVMWGSAQVRIWGGASPAAGGASRMQEGGHTHTWQKKNKRKPCLHHHMLTSRPSAASSIAIMTIASAVVIWHYRLERIRASCQGVGVQTDGWCCLPLWLLSPVAVRTEIGSPPMGNLVCGSGSSGVAVDCKQVWFAR